MKLSNEKIEAIIKKHKQQNPVKKHQEIYDREMIDNTYVIKCPECGSVAASASEDAPLPEWSTCGNIKCNH